MAQQEYDRNQQHHHHHDRHPLRGPKLLRLVFERSILGFLVNPAVQPAGDGHEDEAGLLELEV